MNEKKEIQEATKIAKLAFEKRFGRIYAADILLLETGFDGVRIDYVMFRNKFTNRHLRVTYDNARRRYDIDEVEG